MLKEIVTNITDKGTLILFLMEIHRTKEIDFEELNNKLIDISKPGTDMKNLL